MSPATAKGWESLFWTVFARCPHPMALVDDQRRILEANQPALELLGYTRGCLIGCSVADFVPPDQQAQAETDWDTLLRVGEHAGTRTLVRHDDSHAIIEYAARVVPFPDRQLALVIAAPQAPPAEAEPPPPEDDALTAREREVVRLIALGEDTSEIARELFISPQTVKTHIRNAMQKLGARSRAQLVALSLVRREVTVSIPQAG
jgi:PAS domain S-box-containing protein